MEKAIDAKYLKGLTFRTAEVKKIKGEDGAKARHDPVERPLEPGDVLAYAVSAAGLVIVAGDGRKHTVKISAADRKALSAEAPEKTGETK